MWCLLCGCWSEVWPVALLKACTLHVTCLAWRTGDRQLNSDRHTNSTTYYLSWNCLGLSCVSYYRNFLHFQSAPLYWNHFIWTVEGSAPVSVKYDLVCLWFSTVDVEIPKKSTSAFLLSGGIKGRGNMERESSLKRLLMLHQRWAAESRCTCHRPFVQLSLHSAADASHTLAGVKCCQPHLWPSLKGCDLRVCIVSLT